MCPSETLNSSFEWSPSIGLFKQESRPNDPYYFRNPNLYRYSPWDFGTENVEEEVDYPLYFGFRPSLQLSRETIHEYIRIREEILQESHERLRNFFEGTVVCSRIRERL